MTGPLNTYEPTIRNFKLLAHHELNGFGGMGEGMSIQIAKDGRRILWLAHESAPKNFTAVDVSDPRTPKIVVQTDLPAAAHALQLAGDGRRHHGGGLSDAEARPEARGLRAVRHLGAGKARNPSPSSMPPGPARAACTNCGSATARPCTWRPARPTSWPPTRSTTSSTAPSTCAIPPSPWRLAAGGCRARAWATRNRSPQRHKPPRYDMGFRAHNTNVYPQRPDRVYLGYIDGGMFILDISDRANPKPLCRWDNSPPFCGFTHTVLPLFERELLIVTDEIRGRRRQGLAEADLGPRRPRGDQPCADRHLPGGQRRRTMPSAAAASAPTTSTRTCRCRPRGIPTAIILGTFFNGGLRAYDIADPYQPREVGVFVAAGAAGRPDTAPSSSTTCSSTSAKSCTASIDTSAASTYWKLGSSKSRLGHAPSPSPRIVRPPDDVCSVVDCCSGSWQLMAHDVVSLPGHICLTSVPD